MLQNLLIARARVMASTILGAVKSLVVNLESLVGDTSTEEPMFGALGVVARPKPPPDTATGLHPEGECEALVIKDEDGMQPFAYRDLRITSRLPTLAEGDVFLAGYQGGYVSIRAATDSLGSVVTVRAPRLNSSGVEQLAHSLVLDPHGSAAPAIALTHGSGYSIRITNAGDTEVRDKLVVAPDSSPQQVMLATDLQTWIGQVNAWITAAQAAMTAIAAASGAATNPTVTAPSSVPSAVPASSSKLLAAP